MGKERESREQIREIHELRIDLKKEIQESRKGTDRHRELNRKLDALNEDNDAAHERWFKDLTKEFPL